MSRRQHIPSARPWERVRKQVLVRDDYRCKLCGAYGNEVDHMQPIAAGGAVLDPANLQTLCRNCHIEKTTEENTPEIVDAERTAWADYMVLHRRTQHE